LLDVLTVAKQAAGRMRALSARQRWISKRRKSVLDSEVLTLRCSHVPVTHTHAGDGFPLTFPKNPGLFRTMKRDAMLPKQAFHPAQVAM
jgi:hypothetical protein